MKKKKEKKSFLLRVSENKEPCLTRVQKKKEKKSFLLRVSSTQEKSSQKRKHKRRSGILTYMKNQIKIEW